MAEPTVVEEAEQALYHRAELACQAATRAGLPGHFQTWTHQGLLAVMTTNPAMEFLSTVTGISTHNATEIPALLNSPRWQGTSPTVLTTTSQEVEPVLLTAGLICIGDRTLATQPLTTTTPHPAAQEAENKDQFLQTLLTGYEVQDEIADFIAAEHSHPEIHRYITTEQETPIAAAAMTIHNNVAVLGGASTIRAHRGKGAQPRLLRQRLQAAQAVGCHLATATARPNSTSARNLHQSGFTLHQRTAWKKPN